MLVGKMGFPKGTTLHLFKVRRLIILPATTAHPSDIRTLASVRSQEHGPGTLSALTSRHQSLSFAELNLIDGDVLCFQKAFEPEKEYARLTLRPLFCLIYADPASPVVRRRDYAAHGLTTSMTDFYATILRDHSLDRCVPMGLLRRDDPSLRSAR